LLERERTLKVLAAVQTAAQNEMAFKQRAGVAENLQDLILRHHVDFMPKTKSSKFKIGRVGALRRPYRFFWIPASES